jgi:hypothetical protein
MHFKNPVSRSNKMLAAVYSEPIFLVSKKLEVRKSLGFKCDTKERNNCHWAINGNCVVSHLRTAMAAV